jgi:hypothetical protein
MQNLTDLMEYGVNFGLHSVVLNACFTAKKLDYIARIVGCVVAMPEQIHDDEAIAFLESFHGSVDLGQGPDAASTGVPASLG